MQGIEVRFYIAMEYVIKWQGGTVFHTVHFPCVCVFVGVTVVAVSW